MKDKFLNLLFIIYYSIISLLFAIVFIINIVNSIIACSISNLLALVSSAFILSISIYCLTALIITFKDTNNIRNIENIKFNKFIKRK